MRAAAISVAEASPTSGPGVSVPGGRAGTASARPASAPLVECATAPDRRPASVAGGPTIACARPPSAAAGAARGAAVDPDRRPASGPGCASARPASAAAGAARAAATAPSRRPAAGPGVNAPGGTASIGGATVPASGPSAAPARGPQPTKRVVLLPGDGVGPEVIAEAVRCLEATGLRIAFDTALIGGAALDAGLPALPPETRDRCATADAVLLGAVGGPAWTPGIPERGLLELRQALGVYANLRPVRTATADLLIVRELTGGLYFGEPRWRNEDEAVDTLRYTRREIERLLHVGFRAARGRRRLVTSVDKANVLETSRLWRATADAVARDYPEVTCQHALVDSFAMALMQRPQAFDVVVTENMFGDILSDEAAVLAGSIGLLPSASLGEGAGLYEPVHGAAPDIAGQGIANPYGAILSAAMLLRYALHADAAADALESAVASAMAHGVQTRDLAAPGAPCASTAEAGQEVAARIRSQRQEAVHR